MTTAADGILARVELVAAEAGRRSAEIESQRALPRDLVDALVDSGVFQLAVPSNVGGVGADLASLLRAVRTCAVHDGSVGWLVMSALMAGVDAARLPPHHAATVLGDPRSIVFGHRQPGGTGRPTDDGGLVVTGRWTWGSGASIGSWVGAGVTIVDEDGQQGRGQEGEEAVHCLFRRDQVVVLDTWHALGLRGTGSTDFQVTEAFVPEGRWIATHRDGSVPHRGDVGPWSAVDQRDLVAVGVAAVALGLAARAVDEIAGFALGPAGAGGLARVVTGARAAESLVEQAVADVDLATRTPGASPVDGARLAPAALNAIERSIAVVQRCYRLGGQDAVLHASPLQRLLRDVNTAAQHPAVSPDRWGQIWTAGFEPSI